MWDVVRSFTFPLPPSLLASAMPAITATSHAIGGFNETLGSHVKYSKFSETGEQLGPKVRSKLSMVAVYSPSLAAAVAALALPAVREAPGAALVVAMLGLHFFKRLLESLFLHRYSGTMALESVATISFCYLINTSFIIYTQYLTLGTAPPPVDLKPPAPPSSRWGSAATWGGRVQDPQGGLFGLVTCPHYLFEIMVFAGIACASQTVYSFCVMAGTAFYLMGRSWATRKWYLSKFEDYPREVKALIPFIF
ncbi:unnamed protein product [Spirodela intermedia]|uniref:3-oxo-5-alpha-steroid 4-dehydrogenase C-terminal domain-containing protein n=1 Tax=Spirodela intermedia TaxID=51605 RepID=A0A7I8I7Y9_SPIIN|nr:unnamed protein product [Spirodela intermedia]CAA6653756.1 unnamed protein product [Spirodela intermedia]